MVLKIPHTVSARVQQAIDEFRLIEEERVAVAFSGGKDSTLLALILRNLGYAVTPIVVDMGYESGWASRVVEQARQLELELVVIPVRSHSIQAALEPPRRQKLQLNLTVLDRLGNSQSTETYTPCTSCYNAKVLSFEHELEQLGLDRIAFGHHATDATVSLLKAALMYIDRWDRSHQTYSDGNFRNLVEELRGGSPEAVGGPVDSLWDRISALVKQGLATTDEPPRQALFDASDRKKVVRPMFSVWEHELIAAASDSGLAVESSGCGHSLAAENYTAREIVHFELMRALEARGDHSVVLDWVRQGITESGEVAFNARKHRTELLGPAYKPGAANIDKY